MKLGLAFEVLYYSEKIIMDHIMFQGIKEPNEILN